MDNLNLNSDKYKHNIADDAVEIIYGDREGTYGRPDINCKRIAAFWNVYLEHIDRVELTATDVCFMMDLMKTARLINDPTHRDSLVDKIGYTLLIDRINEGNLK